MTTIGAATTLAGAHAALWLAAPWLAITLTLLEAALTATVVLTALYATATVSDRAFRMLPWTTPPPARKEADMPHPTRRTAPMGDGGYLEGPDGLHVEACARCSAGQAPHRPC